jgi:hypothetical protein
MTLHDSARRIGAYKWAEMRLFEVIGGWVATTPEPVVKAFFAEQCHHHAWHAELWHQRLPLLREIDAESLTQPANLQVVTCFTTLESAETTLERLVGAYRVVLPYLVAAQTEHLRVTSKVSDGPVIRTLNLVLTDEIADWRAGEALAQAAIRASGEVARATKFQAALEAMLVASTGVAGQFDL